MRLHIPGAGLPFFWPACICHHPLPNAASVPPPRDVLLGKSLRLKQGWVAVVNRGQADLNRNVPMAEARSREVAFFKGEVGGWTQLAQPPHPCSRFAELPTCTSLQL